MTSAGRGSMNEPNRLVAQRGNNCDRLQFQMVRHSSWSLVNHTSSQGAPGERHLVSGLCPPRIDYTCRFSASTRPGKWSCTKSNEPKKEIIAQTLETATFEWPFQGPPQKICWLKKNWCCTDKILVLKIRLNLESFLLGCSIKIN